MADIELLEGEEWRPVVGYEGQYEVSNMGRVRSLDRTVVDKNNRSWTQKGKLLHPGKHCTQKNSPYGRYEIVVLPPPRKTVTVHSLVAEAFLGARPEGMDVMHLNGRRDDNRLSNLKYGTRHENIIQSYEYGGKAPRGVFDIETILYIRKRLDAGEGCNALAREYKVAKGIMSAIKQRRTFGWLKEDGSIEST